MLRDLVYYPLIRVIVEIVIVAVLTWVVSESFWAWLMVVVLLGGIIVSINIPHR